MTTFTDKIVIIGSISILILPFILRIKTSYKILFIICGLAAIATTFFESNVILNFFTCAFLIMPFIISKIKKDAIFIKRQ